MDKLSLVGLILALLAIIGGQALEGGTLDSLIQPIALLIVGGGTLGAVLLQHSAGTFKRAIQMTSWVFFPPAHAHYRVVEEMKFWALVSRREGMLALENFVTKIKDPFVRKGLQLVVDGADAETLRTVLEIDLETFEEEMLQSTKAWEAAGGYSPTIGIIGAVMGLIHVMENLSDPGKLGAGIATAFVATIYGVGLANLFYLPVASKLKHHVSTMVQMRLMLIDGFCGIANGEIPTLLENRLNGYIPDEYRQTKPAEKASGGQRK